MALDAQAFHQLPEPGGLRDQPAKLMRTMRACLNVYHAYRAYQIGGNVPGQAGAWRKANPDLWGVVKDVRELRDQYARGHQ